MSYKEKFIDDAATRFAANGAFAIGIALSAVPLIAQAVGEAEAQAIAGSVEETVRDIPAQSYNLAEALYAEKVKREAGQ